MKVHVSTKRVEWAHCDVAGIVFYPHFYTWFDQATERLFRANNLSYGELRRDFRIAGMPLLKTGATYQNPCKLGDDLEIRTCVEAWANRTFLVNHEVIHSDGRLALSGFKRRALVVPAPESEKGIKALEVPDDTKTRFSD